jgi:hypothetical protein
LALSQTVNFKQSKIRGQFPSHNQSKGMIRAQFAPNVRSLKYRKFGVFSNVTDGLEGLKDLHACPR